MMRVHVYGNRARSRGQFESMILAVCADHACTVGGVRYQSTSDAMYGLEELLRPPGLVFNSYEIKDAVKT